jgi:hypothetical protein
VLIISWNKLEAMLRVTRLGKILLVGLQLEYFGLLFLKHFLLFNLK